jgi:hypothetical protein
MPSVSLPELADAFEPTRQSLHAYARAVTALPRAHAIAHPKWWHVSLEARPEGLVTDPVPLPDGAVLGVRLDTAAHEIVVRTSRGDVHRIDLRAGPTATEVGDELIAVASGFGLAGDVDRSVFVDDGERAYDPVAARAYGEAFTAMSTLFERHRATLGDRVGPVQLWPHGFDLAFEWFGTKTAEHEGEMLPAQLNLGFYPRGEPYLYSTPWPFDESLVEVALPHGAVWNSDGWQGARLPYETLRRGDAATVLAEFARAVYDAAAPTLLA